MYTKRKKIKYISQDNEKKTEQIFGIVGPRNFFLEIILLQYDSIIFIS
jgi:hypothetical protein